jgi:hypothetical protein
MPAASRLRRRGQAWFEHPGLPVSPQLRYPGERLACGQRVGGGGAGRFAGVRGRSADPRWLSERWPLAWSACRLCCLGTCPGGRRGTRAVRACGGAVAQQVGSFVGSCVVEVYSKKSDYQSGRPDLNRRPLDPQSRSGRRWTSPGVAQWALDQARQSPGVAGRRLMSACVGSWFGSFPGEGRSTADWTAKTVNNARRAADMAGPFYRQLGVLCLAR